MLKIEATLTSLYLKLFSLLQRSVGSQQLLFLSSKHLVTMSNVTDCVSGQTDLWLTHWQIT